MAAVHTFVPRGGITCIVHSDTLPTDRQGRVDAIVPWTLGTHQLEFAVEMRVTPMASRADSPRPTIKEDTIPVVIARYLSPTERRRIGDQGASYWDSTGNVLIQHADPLIRIERNGAQRSPEPTVREDRLESLKGRGAARVVEYLLTAGGTTGPRDLVRNAHEGVGVATASRVLTLLREQNLFDPTGGGAIIVKDRTALARRLVEDYSFVRSNGAKRYLSPMAREGALLTLRNKGIQVAVTGLQGASEYLAGKDMRSTLPASDLWLYAAEARAVVQAAQLEPAPRDGDIYVADAPWMFETHDFHTAPVGSRAYPWRIAFDLMSRDGRHAQAGEDLLAELVRTAR